MKKLRLILSSVLVLCLLLPAYSQPVTYTVTAEQLQELENQLNEVLEQRALLLRAIQSLSESPINLESILNSYEQKIQILSEQLQNYERITSDLQNTNQRLNRQLEILSQRAKELQTELTELQTLFTEYEKAQNRRRIKAVAITICLGIGLSVLSYFIAKGNGEN